MSMYADVPSGYELRPDSTKGGAGSWWDKYVVDPLQSVFVDPITDVFTPLRDQGAPYDGWSSQTAYDRYDPATGTIGIGSGSSTGGGTTSVTPGGPSTVAQGYDFSGSEPGPMGKAYEQALMALASGKGGGGGGGGGGGSVGGNSTAGLAAMRQRIDAEYGALLGRLDEMYQLAETDEERAMIEFALADLDDQYATAVESIDMVFDEAGGEISGYVQSAEERAAGVGDQLRGEYERGVERAIEQQAMAQALLGEQFGEGYTAATQGGRGEAAMERRVTNMQADREGEYRQSMADLSAEDARWIEANLGSQRAANTAEAGRLQATLRNRAVQEHQRQVQARIQQERMARAAAEQQLIQAQMNALSSIAAQEAQLRQSDINSRRSAAAARAGASASGRAAQLNALAKLAEIESERSGGVKLPSIDLGSGEWVGPNSMFNADSLGRELENLIQAVGTNPAYYDQLATDYVNSKIGGLEYQDRRLAESYLNSLVGQIDPYGQSSGGSYAAGGGNSYR